jgi:hypothetical protein
MRYRREIELVFDLATLQKSPSSCNNITVRYIGPTKSHSRTNSSSSSSSSSNNTATTHHKPTPSPAQAFILSHLQSHIRTRVSALFSRVAPATRRPAVLLRLVADAWDCAGEVEANVRRLNLTFPTLVEVHGDDDDEDAGEKENANNCSSSSSRTAATVKSSILLAPLQTRVEVRLRLGVAFKENVLLNSKNSAGSPQQQQQQQRSVEVTVKPEVGVVYGEPFAAGKMTEFLAGKVGAMSISDGDESRRKMMMNGLGWDEAVLELEKRLLLKGGQR